MCLSSSPWLNLRLCGNGKHGMRASTAIGLSFLLLGEWPLVSESCHNPATTSLILSSDKDVRTSSTTTSVELNMDDSKPSLSEPSPDLLLAPPDLLLAPLMTHSVETKSMGSLFLPWLLSSRQASTSSFSSSSPPLATHSVELKSMPDILDSQSVRSPLLPWPRSFRQASSSSVSSSSPPLKTHSVERKSMSDSLEGEAS
mmetsp:Transcript_26589/g.88147  ORF Transcript_26589/g.88147 Transcript_26589/m.88147 type:complete len:200 (+) Transcript_26589:729-1328(+)